MPEQTVSRMCWWNLWYGFRGRIVGISHLMRGHDLCWRVNADEYCTGDIVCYHCPDTSDSKSTLGIWCRGVNEGQV